VNARASDRNNAANVNADRNNNNGGRAVRSAPSGLPAATVAAQAGVVP
jgi:hypothetical protein